MCPFEENAATTPITQKSVSKTDEREEHSTLVHTIFNQGLARMSTRMKRLCSRNSFSIVSRDFITGLTVGVTFVINVQTRLVAREARVSVRRRSIDPLIGGYPFVPSVIIRIRCDATHIRRRKFTRSELGKFRSDNTLPLRRRRFDGFERRSRVRIENRVKREHCVSQK